MCPELIDFCPRRLLFFSFCSPCPRPNVESVQGVHGVERGRSIIMTRTLIMGGGFFSHPTSYQRYAKRGGSAEQNCLSLGPSPRNA